MMKQITIRLLALICTLFMPIWLHAKELAPATSIASNGVSVVVALVVVIGFIFLLAWSIKKINPAGLQKNTVIKVLATQSMGQRERLVLVAVGDQQLLLGVTAQNISLLHTLDEPLDIPENAHSPFALQLQDVLTRRGA
jgi:flagellar protein FliO/FliZ